MTNLYLALIFICLLAGLFVIVPILRLKRVKLASIDTLTTHDEQIFKQKHQELQADLADDKISQQDFDLANDELTLELASAIERSHREVNQQNFNKFIWLIPVFIIISSVIFYFNQSNYKIVENWFEVQSQTKELGQKVLSGNTDVTKQDLEQFYLALRTKLASEPDNATGWMLLGRVATALYDFEAAIKAYQKSLALDPKNPNILLNYARTLASTQKEQYLLQARAVVQEVAQMEPNNIDVVILAVYIEQFLGNRDKATEMLQYVLKVLPEDDQRAIMIRENFAELVSGPSNKPANPHQAVQEHSTVSTPAESANLLPHIAIDISSLSVKPNYQYLFVFARPAKQGPPFAVQKIELSKTGQPNKVSLTDQNAMMAGMNLSSLSQAYITVRFSHDANVMLAENEEEFHSDLITIHKDKVTEVIF